MTAKSAKIWIHLFYYQPSNSALTEAISAIFENKEFKAISCVD